MRTFIGVGLCALALGLTGCSKGPDETPLKPSSTAFNNNDPRAANAPSAPPITDTPTPGEVMSGKRRGGATPATNQPPAAAPGSTQ